MRTFSSLFSAVATAAVSLVLCSAAFADTPEPLSLTIENHQKLVTVKDASGTWLFAQVISTPNLEITQVSLGQNLSRISLQDASGKPLWSKYLNCGMNDFPIEGEWVRTSSAVMDQTFKSLGPISLGSLASSTPPTELNRQVSIVGSDDQLISTQVFLGKYNFEVIPLKNGVAFKWGEKEVLVLSHPWAPSQTTTTSVAQASAQ